MPWSFSEWEQKPAPFNLVTIDGTIIITKNISNRSQCIIFECKKNHKYIKKWTINEIASFHWTHWDFGDKNVETKVLPKKDLILYSFLLNKSPRYWELLGSKNTKNEL
jgi:hypothetical protein